MKNIYICCSNDEVRYRRYGYLQIYNVHVYNIEYELAIYRLIWLA